MSIHAYVSSCSTIPLSHLRSRSNAIRAPHFHAAPRPAPAPDDVFSDDSWPATPKGEGWDDDRGGLNSRELDGALFGEIETLSLGM